MQNKSREILNNELEEKQADLLWIDRKVPIQSARQGNTFSALGTFPSNNFYVVVLQNAHFP